MREIEENGQGKSVSEEFTQDNTVDLKGRPCLRSKGGRWTACFFIVGYEIFERMAYYGIATNLFVFLTSKLNQGTVKAANNVTNWIGTVWMTPILGAYIADAHLGRYRTFVIASGIYLTGMCLLTLSVTLPSLRPPDCKQKNSDDCKHATSFQIGIFFCALYIIAAGTGGTKPNISTMGADQFDDFEPKERVQKLSFFNWWMFSIFLGTLFANTFLVYIQDNVGWSLGYGLPTVGLAAALLVFLVGTRYYRHKVPAGSPFSKMARVFVAAVRNWRAPSTNDPKELHELSAEDYVSIKKVRIDYTPSLRFLDKAAVKASKSCSPWRLCTVTEVEQTKQMVKMLPILAVTLIPSTMLAQGHTLFLKQGTTLDRAMGPGFDIPPASLTAFVTISMLISLFLYDRFFVPAIKNYTKNPRGITLLQRMTIGLVLHVIIMVTAGFVEKRRLSVAKAHGISGAKETVPLTIFILLPQFALMGIADTFVEVAKIEFFYDQAPEEMKSLGTSYYTSSFGIGNFLSSFLLTTVANITKNHGKGWILNNLNESKLDYYYFFLASLNALNLLVFLVVAKFYVYNVDANFELQLDVNVSSETF